MKTLTNTHNKQHQDRPTDTAYCRACTAARTDVAAQNCTANIKNFHHPHCTVRNGMQRSNSSRRPQTVCKQLGLKARLVPVAVAIQLGDDKLEGPRVGNCRHATTGEVASHTGEDAGALRVMIKAQGSRAAYTVSACRHGDW